jgi:tetrahydromethanopterin S-methyltransferase subunit C
MPGNATRAARLTALAERVPTAPIAAAGLIAGFGVAQATGSRPLGGVVLAALGLTCVAVWVRRDGRRTAAWLTAAGLLAFAISHLLGLVIGAWPSVIVVSAATAALCWWQSDARRPASPAFSAPEPRVR